MSRKINLPLAQYDAQKIDAIYTITVLLRPRFQSHSGSYERSIFDIYMHLHFHIDDIILVVTCY